MLGLQECVFIGFRVVQGFLNSNRTQIGGEKIGMDFQFAQETFTEGRSSGGDARSSE